ncbi:hypothetical protein [Bacillus sp. JCM 19034]|uniref:hypothetical protein n=1 Tax=Bacillus sp. JCM 19034 TaxID=1481928 RepID=UPI000785E6C2|nr:hypothetical protein [Bacillus sp. JCM 19034]
MNKALKGMFLLLITSLLINIYTIINTSDIKNEIELLRERLSNYEQMIDNRFFSIERELLELHEQNQWVTNMTFHPNVAESKPEEHLL